MTAIKLLAELTHRGFTLAAEGDFLRVHPASRLNDVLRQLLRDNRTELLALLRQESLALICPNCARPLDAKGRCWKCCYRICSACGQPTGSAFIELCWPCGLRSREGRGP
jgi:TubC N-terminal docking domain